eukprot:1160695-Pelagomonas_calceolata.AAC.5
MLMRSVPEAHKEQTCINRLRPKSPSRPRKVGERLNNAVFYVYGGIVACTSRTTGWVCAREIRGEEGGNIEKWESGCPTNPIVSNTTFGVLYTVYSSGDTVSQGGEDCLEGYTPGGSSALAAVKGTTMHNRRLFHRNKAESKF